MNVPPRIGPAEAAGVPDAVVPPGAGVQAATTSATEARTMKRRFTVILPRPAPSDAGRRHSAPDYRHPGPSSSTCHPFPVEGGADDMTKVKAALVQCAWTGDKDSMIERHVKYIGDAAKQGAQVMCLQELFYGPYFCQVQDA